MLSSFNQDITYQILTPLYPIELANSNLKILIKQKVTIPFSMKYRNSQMEDTLQNKQSKPYKPVSYNTTKQQYSVEKLLRETTSFHRFKPFSESLTFHKFRNFSRPKCLPTILAKMNLQKKDFESTLYKNHGKLNSSFSQYFKSEINTGKDVLLKKKVTKLKKIEKKGDNTILSPPVEREENTLYETNLHLIPLLNRCFDSLFPTIRYNPVLVSMEKNVYLLGGYHEQGFQGLSLFHKYDFQDCKWQQVQSQGDCPKIAPCFHAVQIYRNYLIIVGGVSLDNERGKKFNSELLIFNLQKAEWMRARGGVTLKHHATTLFGSFLMISGGVNEKQKQNEDLIFINFSGNIQSPLIYTISNHGDQHQKLSHHKIIHTYDVDPSIRSHIKLDGIFSFGGQDQNGILNNDLLWINVLGKVSQNLDLKFKKWEVVSVGEEKPCPRMDHSFTVINKRGIAVLAGGIDQYGQRLSDIWILDLVRLNWSRVNTQPKIEESIGAMACQSSCAVGSTMYLYNGNVDRKREKAFWALQTDVTNFNKSKKNLHPALLPSYKSIHSDKQNYSMGQI